MQSHILILALLATLSSTISASVLSTTDIASVLAGAEDQSALTLPLAPPSPPSRNSAPEASTPGASVRKIRRPSRTVWPSRVLGTLANKAGLGGGTGSAGNIAFVSAKTTLHACETAQQQIALAGGDASASDTSVNLLISNVGLLNANTKAAGLSGKKRAVEFKA